MSAGRPAVRLLVEKLLEGGGSVPLVILLQTCVRVSRLRDLVRKLGLSPKGGVRVGTARAEVLAGILAEVKDPQQLDEIFTMLAVADEKSAPPGRGAAAKDLQPVLELRGQALATVQRELEKARDVAAHLRVREGELGRRLALERENAARLRGEVGSARQQLESVPKAPAREEDQDRRVRELEREIDALNEAVEGLHRKLRLYFDVREDGDVDVLALVDREDQHTALRRVKDR